MTTPTIEPVPAEGNARRLRFRVPGDGVSPARLRFPEASVASSSRRVSRAQEGWADDADELELLADPEALERIGQSERDFAAGDTLGLTEILAVLAARRGAQ